MFALVMALPSGGARKDRPVDLTRIRENHSRVERLRESGGLWVEFGRGDWPNVMVTADGAWDWSDAGGLALDVRNAGTEPVEFGVRLDDDPSAGRSVS